MINFIFIYITNPSMEEAKKIARHLLDKRLIACGNIYGAVSSIYRWKGDLVEDEECVLIAKTTEANYENVKKEVEKIHPYDVPCIIRIPVSSNKSYFDWLRGEVKG